MRPGGSAQAHQVANSHGRPVCSLSACGERVGVRGPVQKGGLVEGKGAFPRSSDSWRGPLAVKYVPRHPATSRLPEKAKKFEVFSPLASLRVPLHPLSSKRNLGVILRVMPRRSPSAQAQKSVARIDL